MAPPNYIGADLRDLDKIPAAAADTLDFTKPIAITMSRSIVFERDGRRWISRPPNRWTKFRT